MEEYKKVIDIRWSDLDPNMHLRHSVYYDYGAFCRLHFLEEHGLSTASLKQMNLGFILFREEAVFRKEVLFGDRITIDLHMTKCRKDYSRWSMRHQLTKNEDTLCTLITVDGAWINTELRKLATPSGIVVEAFESIPRSTDFTWI